MKTLCFCEGKKLIPHNFPTAPEAFGLDWMCVLAPVLEAVLPPCPVDTCGALGSPGTSLGMGFVEIRGCVCTSRAPDAWCAMGVW